MKPICADGAERNNDVRVGVVCALMHRLNADGLSVALLAANARGNDQHLGIVDYLQEVSGIFEAAHA